MTDPNKLESRVATIEAQLQTLAGDVSDLVGAVRKQGEQMGLLAIAIERSSAPKRTEWLAIIGTAIGSSLLFISIGTLVLTPMNKEMHALEIWRQKHIDLELHPVGKSRIDALEKNLLEHATVNAAGIRELDTKLQVEMRLLDGFVSRGLTELDARLQREMLAIDASAKAVAAASTKNFDDLKQQGSPALRERITALETLMRQGTK